MAHFQLVLIKPRGFNYVEAFRDVMDTVSWGLQALGHEVSVVENRIEADVIPIIFGVHHLTDESWGSLPRHSIIYNMEQLIPGYPWYSEALMKFLATRWVWDCCLENVDRLAAMGGHVSYVPVGYAPCLERVTPSPAEDVDVLFYGVMSPRRLAVLQALRDEGCAVMALVDVWGADRDQWIGRSKLVLNIRQKDQGYFEWVRVSYLMANAKAVVAERAPVRPSEQALMAGVALADYGDLANTCRSLLADADQRHGLASRAKSIFSGAQYRIENILGALSPQLDRHIAESA